MVPLYHFHWSFKITYQTYLPFFSSHLHTSLLKTLCILVQEYYNPIQYTEKQTGLKISRMFWSEPKSIYPGLSHNLNSGVNNPQKQIYISKLEDLETSSQYGRVGLRRQFQVLVRKGVGSNPTVDSVS